MRLAIALAAMGAGCATQAFAQAAAVPAAAPPAVPAATSQNAPTVLTDKGAVRGVVEANGVLGYKGIPYAADTGGANRFLPPKAPAAWKGEYDATAMGPACPQQGNIVGSRPQGEDCLRVSVWTRSLEKKRPVIVWLHGGAYRIGSDNYAAEGADGASAAGSGDYVFVSLTMRLNVLGYLQLGPEYGREYAGSGNVGLMDIVAALEWVKRNVAKFGGDPDNVTIAGPSGGGSKTMHMLAVPEARGLFRHAVVFVGHDLWKRNPREAAQRSSNAVLDKLGVKRGDVKALREMPLATLLAAYGEVSVTRPPDPAWGAEGWINYDLLSPHIDGRFLPQYPMDAIAAGASRDVDLIVSSDKWTHLILPRTPPASFDTSRYGRMSEAELSQALHGVLGDRTEQVIAGYRAALPGASPSSLLAAINTDRDWWIPALRLAEAKAKGGRPARVMFNSSGPGAHSFLFGTNIATPFPRALLGQVQGAYAAFAGTGNPNYPGIPQWPEYTPEARNVMMLDYDAHVAVDPFGAERRVWDGIR